MEDVNENVDVIVYEGKTIKVSEFPSLLTQQVSLIKDNSDNIDKAKEKAEKAKAAAEKAKNTRVKWNNKKASIEALQEALEPMIDALDGQTDIANSLSKSIRAVSDATRFLFVLGVSNMAANRMVIRELELKLSNASKEQLSVLAQQELQNVLYQLKAQEDTFLRIEKLEEKNKKLAKKTENLSNTYDKLWSRFEKHKTDSQFEKHKTDKLQNRINVYKVISFAAIVVSVVSLLFALLK